MATLEKLRRKKSVIRAAAYARFSSDHQREESIEAQLRAIREYAEKKRRCYSGRILRSCKISYD